MRLRAIIKKTVLSLTHILCYHFYVWNIIYIMKTNILVIIFSGISIAFLGIAILTLPQNLRSFAQKNIEIFLTIPPVSVASYILVFKYHEKFQGGAPPMDALFVKIFQGAVAAGVCFFIIAFVSSILFRCYTIFRA